MRAVQSLSMTFMLLTNHIREFFYSFNYGSFSRDAIRLENPKLKSHERFSPRQAWGDLDIKALVNEDTLLPMMFLGLRKVGNICSRAFVADTKCFWTKSETFFVRDTKFVSATNVAHAGKRGNICVGNNVSATMCPRLPGPLVWKPEHYFEFWSYGEAWHKATIVFVKRQTLISWYLAILGVKVLCKCFLVKFRYSVDQVARFALFSSRNIGGPRSPLSSVLGKFA